MQHSNEPPSQIKVPTRGTGELVQRGEKKKKKKSLETAPPFVKLRDLQFISNTINTGTVQLHTLWLINVKFVLTEDGHFSRIQMARAFLRRPSESVRLKFREASYELLCDFLANLNQKNKDNLNRLSPCSGKFRDKRLMGKLQRVNY